MNANQKKVYEAIANAIADALSTGTLAAGEQLPTQRALAHRLGVTVGTVSRAYLGDFDRISIYTLDDVYWDYTVLDDVKVSGIGYTPKGEFFLDDDLQEQQAQQTGRQEQG